MSDPVDPKRVPRPLRSALRAEREATIARLQDAVASDHLELDELEERLDLALTATTSDELRVLVQDLPAASPSQATISVMQRADLPALVEPARAAPLPALAPARQLPVGADGAEPEPMSFTAVFSGSQLEGRRVLPRLLKARAVFGGVVLDLREATFLPGVTTVKCSAVFGGVEIKVPPHVRLECVGSGVFGGFEGDRRDDGADEAELPVLRVTGLAVFGGVHAQRPREKRRRRGAAALEDSRARPRLPR